MTETATIEKRPAPAWERGCPLVPSDAMPSLTLRTRQEISEAVDRGDYRFVFDLALKPGESRKRMLRFLGYEIAAVAAGQKFTREWDEVFSSLLFPGEGPTLPTPCIAFVFNVKSDHVINLGKRKCLEVARRGRRGPDGVAQFTRASVQHFLGERRLS